MGRSTSRMLRLLGALTFVASAAAKTTGAIAIEHVVLLLMENRPFDQFYGFAQPELTGNIDGLTGEIAAGQEEMQTLAAAIDDKTPALDLAKTRLSARVSRPGIERVRDVAERALEAEVMDLSRAIQELALSRERVVANMARLEASREQLSMDLADKEVGLKIDSQCHAKVSAIKY